MALKAAANSAVDVNSLHMLALVPYVSILSPANHLYLRDVDGVVALGRVVSSSLALPCYGATAACCMQGGAVVGSPETVGRASLVGELSAPAGVGLGACGCLLAIGMWVYKRSWSDRLYRCYGE
jgi:hypothetical protein